MSLQVDMWGAPERLSPRQARDRAQALCDRYRRTVQEAVLAGAGLDAAHAAARPLQRQAVAVLVEAGIPPIEARGFVALEFHG